MKSKDLIKEIEKAGWYLIAVKGSHYQFKHPMRSGKVTIPHPKEHLPPKTIRSIRKQAGLLQEKRLSL